MKALLIVVVAVIFFLFGCSGSTPSQQAKEVKAVNEQQEQYSIAQPIPRYDISLERDLVIKLYNLRNERVATHSVWRSDYGLIEGDCPSMGFGIPYDTSLTNPWLPTDREETGYNTEGLVAIGQPEPNGIFASTNTAATWVMCVSEAGLIEPHYIETKVTVYPYSVEIDYSLERPRVMRFGESSVNIGE
jgi:hypothetical protein